TICLGILMGGFVPISTLFGTQSGNRYLFESSVQMVFPMFFFVMSLGGYKEVRGYLRPITAPFSGLFPQNKRFRDISGISLTLSTHHSHEIKVDLLSDKAALNQDAELKRRLVVDDNLESYIAQLSMPIEINGLF